MALSDSDSDDSSSCGSFVDDDHLYSTAKPKITAAKNSPQASTTTTFVDSDSSCGNVSDVSTDDSSEDEAPARRGGRRPGNTVKRNKSFSNDEPPKRRMAPSRNKSFEGDEHMKMRALIGNFKKHTTYDTKPIAEKRAHPQSSLNLEAAEKSINKVKEVASRARNELDSSAHMLNLLNKQLEEDAAAIMGSGDDNELDLAIPKVEEFSFANLQKGSAHSNKASDEEGDKGAKKEKKAKKSKKKEKEKEEMKQAEKRLALQMRETKREERMARVRERLEREEEEKLEKERQERLKAMEPDNSEATRREKIYSWYLRMGLPNKEKFTEKVAMLPYSAGVTEEDIALLTWNKRETRAFRSAELY